MESNNGLCVHEAPIGVGCLLCRKDAQRVHQALRETIRELGLGANTEENCQILAFALNIRLKQLKLPYYFKVRLNTEGLTQVRCFAKNNRRRTH